MDLHVKQNYENFTANRIMKQLDKQAILLNTKEAIEIANQLEGKERLENEFRRNEENKSVLVNTVLKVLSEIDSGKPLNDLLTEYGIILPGKTERHESGFFCGYSQQSYGCYNKVKIEHHEGGGWSTSNKFFRVNDNSEFNSKF